MRTHIERWQTLTLSPADRAILDQMEEEERERMETEHKRAGRGRRRS